MQLASALEAKGKSIQDLAEHASKEDGVEPMVRTVAACPAPTVVADGAVHVRTASPLLNSGVAPRARVDFDVACPLFQLFLRVLVARYLSMVLHLALGTRRLLT